ncbi:uncharacterized protein LOC142775324 [Rhipicephalus microplus]|uniref:uncharacterized protein LOC142775324 n=1 Tax=Rhipicephalus microplus TaxID=6941 RepID=UPI003F6CE591
MEQEREKSRLRIQEERELLSLHQQSTPQSGQTTGSETAGRMHLISPHKLMPPFNEARDDLDAYLRSAGITEKYTEVTERLPVLTGLVGDREVRILRDTGCNTVIVKTSLVYHDDFTGTSAPVYLLERSVRMLREAWVDVETPFYSGRLKAKCIENPLYDLILGNVDGVRPADDPDLHWNLPKKYDVGSNVDASQDAKAEMQELLTDDGTGEEPKGQEVPQANPAVTRSQSCRETTRKKLRVPESSLDISREALVNEQKNDLTLQAGFNHLNVEKHSKNGDHHTFFIQEGLLQRRYVSKSGEEPSQVVVPEKLRVPIMHLDHDGAMGGHQGVKKTLSKIRTEFFWPGMQADMKRFVASCDICQQTAPKGHTRKVPLVKVPIISTPFEKVAIDIVGPLFPRSTQDNKYILTMVDYATRYPDAVVLPIVEIERVAEALVEMFSHDCSRAAGGSKGVVDKYGFFGRVEHTCRLAHEELERAGERYGKYYNLKSRKRSLKPGEQVLILLPTDNNKLLMQWKGPFMVVSKKGDADYEVEIGAGELSPLSATLEKIQRGPRPTTKRQVRSFLGLTGYYREFISDYATLTSPLSDLTRKGLPNTVKWGPDQDSAFVQLKKCLTTTPILKLPDFERQFVLRTGASDRGIGAVLLQEHEQILHPVTYASRKLLPREVAYSTVKKEALALVWRVEKF